ncbi:MAG: hypothetical protein AB8B99_25230 [Phormidesmis sp.]
MNYKSILNDVDALVSNLVGEQLGFWHCGYHPWPAWGWAATNAHQSNQNSPWAKSVEAARCEVLFPFPQPITVNYGYENRQTLNCVKQTIAGYRPTNYFQHV